MSNDVDFDLASVQWEALRALRNRPPNGSLPKAYVIDELIKLGLVAVDDGVPAITPIGRKALVRGSCRLLDLVA
jgi:hypothetical protein